MLNKTSKLFWSVSICKCAEFCVKVILCVWWCDGDNPLVSGLLPVTNVRSHIIDSPGYIAKWSQQQYWQQRIFAGYDAKWSQQQYR